MSVRNACYVWIWPIIACWILSLYTLDSGSFVTSYGANAQQQYSEYNTEKEKEPSALLDEEEYYGEFLQENGQLLTQRTRSGRRLQEWGDGSDPPMPDDGGDPAASSLMPDEGGEGKPTTAPPTTDGSSNSSGNATSGTPSIDYLTAWYTDRTAGSIHIEWSISQDWSGSLGLISSFIVEFNGTNTDPITVASTLRNVELIGLNSLTTYAVQVKAIRFDFAILFESKTLIVSTLDPSAPNAPRAVNVKSVGGGYIEVEVLPSYFTGGVDLVSMTVRVQSIWDSTVMFKTQNSTNATLRIYGLKASTAYYLTAFVTNAKGFSSPDTALPYVQTAALQPPGKAPPPIVLDVTGGSVRLQMSPPEDDGGASIKGYLVYMAEENSELYEEVVNTVQTSTPMIADILWKAGSNEIPLTLESQYSFKVLAVNMYDICLESDLAPEFSTPITVNTTSPMVPDTPPPPYFVSATGGMITIQLTKPLNMKGSELAGFGVSLDSERFDSINTQTNQQYTYYGLDARRTYRIEVAALTNIGQTDWSQPLFAYTTALTEPSSPRNIVVVDIMPSKASVTWNAPLDSGGGRIAAYKITLQSAEKIQILMTDRPFILLKDLLAKTAYNVKVSAIGSDGRESVADSKLGTAFETKPPTPPTEPWGIAIQDRTGGSIEVKWNPPQETGGTSLDAMMFNVTQFSLSSCFTAGEQNPCSSCELVNVVRQKELRWMNASNFCGVPIDISCPSGGNACCQVTSESSVDFGYPCLKINSSNKHKVLVGSYSYSFMQLNHSTKYYFGVQAINDIGAGRFSNIAELTTRDPSAPSFPRYLQKAGGTGGSIVLNWTTPLDTGGGSIVGYRVYRDYRLITPVMVQPPFYDCGGLIASSQYSYGVVAVNGSLNEGKMVILNTWTESLSIPLPPSYTLQSRTVSSLKINLTPHCDIGGSNHLHFQYSLDKDGTTVQAGIASCCIVDLQNLESSSVYVLSIRAINDAGASTWVSTSYSTTTGVPTTPVLRVLKSNTFSLLLGVDPTMDNDREILSYDFNIFQEKLLVAHSTIQCDKVVETAQLQCGRSVRFDNLNRNTIYNVTVLALGPLGVSDVTWSLVSTSDEEQGVIEFTRPDYYAMSGGKINVTLHRKFGAAGLMRVGINVTQPENVLLRCTCEIKTGCFCGMHLEGSGVQSVVGQVTFADGQEFQTVIVSVWEDDRSVRQPLNVLLSLLGPSNDFGTQKDTILRIDLSQRPGFASFIRSKSEVFENSTYVRVNVIRLNGSSGVLPFEVETFDLTAKAMKHYVPYSKSLEFDDRQSQLSVWIKLVNNIFYDGVRVFGIRLRDLSGYIKTDSVVTRQVIIMDDEDPSKSLPGIPESFDVLRSTGGEIELQWEPPTGIGQTLGYLLRVEEMGSSRFFNLYNTSDTSFVLSQLLPERSYKMTLSAWNIYGTGEEADSIYARTTDPSPPTTPQFFEAIEVGSSMISFVWSPPRDSGGVPVTGYLLWMKSESDENVTVYQSWNISTTFMLYGLEALHTYQFYIAASTSAFTASFESEASTIVVIMDKATFPDPPSSPKLLSNSTAGTFSIKTVSSRNTGGIELTGYTLYMRKDIPDDLDLTDEEQEVARGPFRPVCTAESVQVNDIPQSCVVYKLLAGTSYEFYSKVNNAVGESLQGPTSVFTTSHIIEVPSVPLNFRASSVTAGNIELTWDYPMDFGGVAEIVGFMVYQKNDLNLPGHFMVHDGQDSNITSALLRGLSRDRIYSFAVVALNYASFCIHPKLYHVSKDIEVSTLVYSPLTPPEQPYLVSATGGSVTFSWSPPDDLAGIPLRGYLTELSTGNGQWEKFHEDLLSPYTTSFTHYGLQEKTSYEFAVTAVNDDGPSERSEILVASTIPATAPTAVRYLMQSGERYGGKILIQWERPLDTGGRNIEYYRISRIGREGFFYSTTEEFVDIYELSAWTAYQYEVKAFNGLFSSPPNQIWAQTSEPQASDPPLFSRIIPYGGKISVEWVAPDHIGGAPIQNYLIQVLSDDGKSVVKEYKGLATSYVFNELTAETKYTLKGATVNMAGISSDSALEVATGPTDLPSKPRVPAATYIRGGSMIIEAFEPEYSGGENVTLHLFRGNSLLHTFEDDDHTFTVYGLFSSTQYAFTVAAANSRGDVRSDPLTVSTGSISTPGSLGAVELEEKTFNHISIKWPRILDTGGDMDLTYVVKYVRLDSDGAQAEELQTSVVQKPELRLTQLRHTSQYKFWLFAKTSTGLEGPVTPEYIFETDVPYPGRIILEKSMMEFQEDGFLASIPVIRLNGSFGTASCSYYTTDGTAKSGVDYQGVNGTLTLEENILSGVIDVAITNDAAYDPQITFTLTVIDSITNEASVTVVQIIDDGDAGFISFDEESISFSEFNEGEVVTLYVTRSGGLAPQSTVTFEFTDIVNPDRFALVEDTLIFEEGQKYVELQLQIFNDDEYQMDPDYVDITLTIVDGGPRYGKFRTIKVLALDDEDLSLPEPCTGVQLIGATGGAMYIGWKPPVDHGGANVFLTYNITVMRGGALIAYKETANDSDAIYGLSASTTYEVYVAAVNPRGTGPDSRLALFTTLRATKATIPRNIQLVQATSSTLKLSWDLPIDFGGSKLISYKVFNVSADGSRNLLKDVSFPTLTGCIVDGLKAEFTYLLQIAAVTLFVSEGELSSPEAYRTMSADIPDAPPSAQFPWVSAGAIKVQMFDPPNVGGADIIGYRLYMRHGSDTFSSIVYEGSNQTTTLYRLNRQFTYSFSYQVQNEVGYSEISEEVAVQTLDRSLPFAPSQVALQWITGGAVSISWNEPLDIGGREIAGYSVLVQSNISSEELIGYDGKFDPRTWGTIYDLNQNTSYYLTVVTHTDISNCFDQNAWYRSPPFFVSTLPTTLPGDAPSLFLSRTTGGLLELVWTEPKDKGGVPIIGYELKIVTPAGTEFEIFRCSGTDALTYTHADLTDLTTYSYIVYAYNALGPGQPSKILQAQTTEVTPPSAPLNVRQIGVATGGAITIAWDRPIDAGGKPIKGYWIYREGVAIAQDLPATTRSFLDKVNLVAGNTYEYTVRAVSMSSIGSEYSEICAGRTTAATKPQKPYIVSMIPTSSKLTIKWAPDSDTGGVPIRLYQAKLLSNSMVVRSYLGTDTSVTFSGLLALKSFQFSLTSTNEIGTSDEHKETFSTLPVSLPAAPSPPLVISAYGGNFTLEMYTPLDDGGAPITTMYLYDSKRGKIDEVKVFGVQIRRTIYGVSRETDYTISCSAANSLGEGLRSEVTTIRTTPLNAPGDILTRIKLLTTTGQTLSISWDAPIDTGGESDTLSYEIQAIDTSKKTLLFSSIARNIVLTGLTFDTKYEISVRATNRIPGAYGGWSPTLVAFTQPDQPGTFSFATSSVSVYENASFVGLQIIRSNGLSGKITLTLTASSPVMNGATVGSDFGFNFSPAKSTSSIIFEPLEKEKTLDITIFNDLIYEGPSEVFSIQIVVGTNGAKIGSPATTTVSILDDGDAGTVSFVKSTYSVSESDASNEIGIVRENGKSSAITLQFTAIDISATVDRDYRRPPTTLIMKDGQTTATLKINMINDRIYEFPNESFQIQMKILSGGAVVTSKDTVTITILDDGDVSAPGACGVPKIISTTGGAATIQITPPLHNGSSTGPLLGYIIRVYNNDDFLQELTIPAQSQAYVGSLTAFTTYNVSVAAFNSIDISGRGNFGEPVEFTTNKATLPSAVKLITSSKQTGGSITLRWSQPDDTGGVPISKYRVYLVSKYSSNVAVELSTGETEATVYGLMANTSYLFTVQAGNLVVYPELANGWGEVSESFAFSTSLLTQPGALKLSDKAYGKSTGGAISLSWSLPLDTGGESIQGYQIYCRNASTPFFLGRNNSVDPLRHTTVKRLFADNWYEFFVLARNSYGDMLLPATVKCSPGASVMYTNTSMIEMISMGSILRIKDHIFVIGDMSLATPQSVPLYIPNTGQSFNDEEVWLVGQASNFVTLSTTSASIPQAPPAAMLWYRTGGLLALELSSPDDTGGIPIQDFNVYMSQNEDDTPKLLDIYRLQTNITQTNDLQSTALIQIGDLEPISFYSIKVVAVNAQSVCSVGTIRMSEDAIFETSNMTAPDAPILKRKAPTGGGMVLFFDDPFDKGGQSIIRRRVYIATLPSDTPKTMNGKLPNNISESSLSWTLATEGPDPSVDIAPLKPNTSYAIRASVNNGVFESINSTANVVRTTDISAPGKSGKPRLINRSGGMLNVTWDPPKDNGGAIVTSYLVSIILVETRETVGMVRVTKNFNAFFGLLAENEYEITVRATNRIGSGEQVSGTHSTSAATPPSGNIDIQVLTSTGGATVIAFDSPSDLGGADPLDIIYQVYVDLDNILNVTYEELQRAESSVPESISTNSTSRRLKELSDVSFQAHRRLGASSGILLGGLNPKSSYDIQVRATSWVGSGNVSDPSPAQTTAATVPQTPTNLMLDKKTGGSLKMVWDAPIDTGGLPLDTYILYMSTSENGVYVEKCRDLFTYCTIQELMPTTMYWFYVVAINGIGVSANSIKISATTRSGTPPSSPGKPIITGLNHNSVSLEWKYPRDVGGYALSQFNIELVKEHLENRTSRTLSVTSNSTIITALQPYTIYSVRIVAENFIGDTSDPSLIRYFQTASTSDAPASPMIGCVSISSIGLSWFPYPQATGYIIERNGTEIYKGTELHLIDENNIVPDEFYTYQLYATVDGSKGSRSASITIQALRKDKGEHAICVGLSGIIEDLNYSSNTNKTWIIDPDVSYSTISFQFYKFDLECDHDYVELRYLDDDSVLWKGGCERKGDFFIQSDYEVPIKVTFISDSSVNKKGFEMSYELDGSSDVTRIPPPGDPICSKRGRSLEDGSCACSPGITGESCNNRMVCCQDKERCYHPICDIVSTRVIVVSDEFGDDITGTGEMMDASETGTSSKAVQSLSKALSISQPGSIIFLYPDVYSGVSNIDLKVANAKNLTITSLRGSKWTSINCDNTTRALSVDSFDDLLIQGLSIRHCEQTDGGALHLSDSQLSLVDVSLSGTAASKRGGAVYGKNSVLSLLDVVISDCASSGSGGALFLQDTDMYATYSTLQFNNAIDGGAIALNGSSNITGFQDVILMNNSATNRGGGLMIYGHSMIDHISIHHNLALSGGALAIENGSMSIIDSVIENNTALNNGGGFSIFGSISISSQQSNISLNKAQDAGGGIYGSEVTGTLDFADSIVHDNQASQGGGMLFVNSSVIVQNLVLNGGTATMSGGGIEMQMSTVTLTNSTIQQSSAPLGGAISVLEGSSLQLAHSVLRENTATYGGALAISNSNISGTNSTLRKNHADEQGGGVFLTNSAVFNSLKIIENTAAHGAGMHIFNATVDLSNTNVSDSVASVSGGALAIESSIVSMNHVAITKGAAKFGGGIYVDNATLTGQYSIDSCNAISSGGGLFVTGHTVISSLNVASSNADFGGAMYVENSTFTLEDAAVKSSNAVIAAGGLYSLNATIVLKKVDFSSHKSIQRGGAILANQTAIYHSDVTVTSSSADIGGGVYLFHSSFDALTGSSHCKLTSNIARIDGGNLFIAGQSRANNIDIKSGKAQNGGGVKAEEAFDCTLKNVLITQNEASIYGGGIELTKSSSCEMTNVKISKNTAKEQGGALAIDNSIVYHDNVKIYENYAPTGGGLRLAGKSSYLLGPSAASNSELYLNHVEEEEDNFGHGAKGGNVYIVRDSEVEVSGVNVQHSTAQYGAGLYVNDVISFELKDSYFQNNTAYEGGGIYFKDGGQATLINIEFNENLAYSSGGAFHVAGDEVLNSKNSLKVNVVECTFIFNAAMDYGGAISLTHASLILQGNSLEQNIVLDHGGGAIASLAKGIVNISESEFIGNTFMTEVNNTIDGGAIYGADGSKITLKETQVLSSWDADLVRRGGLIFIKDVTSSLHVYKSQLNYGEAYSGAGIYVEESKVFLYDSEIAHGWGNDFGGGIFGQDASIYAENTNIFNNSAYYDGGGVIMKGKGTLTLENSTFELNHVQDRGGGLLLWPGAGIECKMNRTTFRGNWNLGLGAAIFAGRKNMIKMTQSIIASNGKMEGEGGSIYAVDVIFDIEDSQIYDNRAAKGGAFEISRDTSLTLTKCTLRDNQAETKGGVIHASVRSIVNVKDCLIQWNQASIGGAIFAMGASKIKMIGTTSEGNSATDEGGGVISAIGYTILEISQSRFQKNTAHYGGVVQVKENVTLSLVNSDFILNDAHDFGGALYVDSSTKTKDTKIQCSFLRFTGNEASKGDDIYWVYHGNFIFQCDQCSSDADHDFHGMASSPMNITAGWWPEIVTSGVSLTYPKANITDPNKLLPNMTSPSLDALWPSVLIKDYYGNLAHMDNDTRCFAGKMASENDSFAFFPASSVQAQQGYVNFLQAMILSISRPLPYTVEVTCEITEEIQVETYIQVQVEPCQKGYQNVDGICTQCRKGTYSIDGVVCYPCPIGASCQHTDIDGTEIGVGIPTRDSGYYLWSSQQSMVQNDCQDPSTWDLQDPCRQVNEPDLAYRIHRCSKLPDFDQYWSRKRIFACLSGLQFYTCDTGNACIKEERMDFGLSFNKSAQCDEGYGSVMCSTCTSGFYKVSNGKCKPCSDLEDPAVARMTRMITIAPMIVACFFLIAAVIYFHNSTEKEILKRARMAKQFKILHVHGNDNNVFKSMVYSMGHMLTSCRRRLQQQQQQEQILFGIKPKPVPMVFIRAEKFKIMLAFFQIFASFKKMYEIPWSSTMTRLMDLFSQAQFNIIETTGMECFLQKNYFIDYQLSLASVVLLSLLLGFILIIGVYRYRATLGTLPRHCVKCGLPVKELTKKCSRSFIRRQTLISNIKTKRLRLSSMVLVDHKNKKTSRFNFINKNNTMLQQIKAKMIARFEIQMETFQKWFQQSRIGLFVDKMIEKTRIASSTAEHYPKCPTLQPIEQKGDVQQMIVRSNLRLWKARIRLRLNYITYQNKCIKLFFWVILLFYPDLSQRVIGMFYCEEIGDQYHMSSDKSHLCYQGTWLYFLPLTLALVVVWVAGVPFLLFCLLFYKRHDGIKEKLLLLEDVSYHQMRQRLVQEMIQDLENRGIHYSEKELQQNERMLLGQYLRIKRLNEPSMIARLGFMYHSYNVNFWWYEVWDLLRKLFLNCIIGLLAKSGANRMIAGLIVFLVYLSVLLFFQPYKEQSDSLLAGVTQIQLFITLFCGLILRMGSRFLDESVQDLLTYTALGTNCLTIAFGLFSILYERIEMKKELQRQHDDEYRDKLRAHVRKLWKKAYGFAFTEVYLRDTTLRPMPLVVIMELSRRHQLWLEIQELERQEQLWLEEQKRLQEEADAIAKEEEPRVPEVTANVQS